MVRRSIILVRPPFIYFITLSSQLITEPQHCPSTDLPFDKRHISATKPEMVLLRLIREIFVQCFMNLFQNTKAIVLMGLQFRGRTFLSHSQRLGVEWPRGETTLEKVPGSIPGNSTAAQLPFFFFSFFFLLEASASFGGCCCLLPLLFFFLVNCSFLPYHFSS